MGRMSAIGMLEASGDMEQAVRWHFSGNCYPPIPPQMVPVALAAIEAANDNDYGREIILPDGVLFRGSPSCSAGQAIDGLFLEAFVTYEDEDGR
ncbi:MAG: hypothetical protein WC965_01185 [Thiohalomonadaceae bacterium]